MFVELMPLLKQRTLRSLRTNSAVMPMAITMRAIDSGFMVELFLITRAIRQHFLDQPATTGERGGGGAQ
jgi:hypothetical protein